MIFECRFIGCEANLDNQIDIIIIVEQMDFLFPQKNAPLILSRHLRQLIETIGQTKTKQQQQKIIKAEIQIVKQQLLHQVNPNDYPDIIVKLIYFETMGYNTSFARILPINLCQSQSPYLKKISYLLSAMLVKPGQKLVILMHNTIMKDLESDNVFTNLTVLTMLRYFINDDLAKDIMPFLRKMLKHKLAMTRRKSLLVLHNIYQLYPHLIDDFKDIVLSAFSDPQVPVMFGALTIMRQLIMGDASEYKNLTGKVVQVFDKIMDHKYPPEYDYHKVPFPWMQIDILKMLQKLGKNDAATSKLMYDALDKCMRRSQNIYMHFNKGILQQCIKTVSHIYPHQYLLAECQSSLHAFFSQGNNNNIKSFGLAAMIHLAKVRPGVLDKWQLFLIECLQSQDITLAQRTIGLLVEIANQDNTEVILNRIINLTEKSTDAAEKKKLIKNSIYLIQRFSNDKQIFLRRMNQIFYKFQQFVSDASINNFLKTLQEMVELDQSFVDLLVKTYIQILQNFRNNALVKVSVWTIGEMTHKMYLRDKNSEDVDRSVDAILSCADQYLSNNNIIFTIICSLMKLSPIQMTSRHDKIKQLLLKVQSQLPFPIHKCGQQFIRIAKYSKALYGSNELQFDPKMRFLTNFVNENYEPPSKKFMITKRKSERAQLNDVDLLSNDSTTKKQQIGSNIFEFKPGHRWGTTQQTKPQIQTQQVKQNKERKQSLASTGQNKMILRGPHQQKKSKPNIDEKKLKLAKSIFAAKK